MEAILLLTGKAFMSVAIVSGIPLLCTSLVGLLTALLQATTQVQEQCLVFLVKVGAISILFLFLGTYLLQHILSFLSYVLTSFAYLGALT